MDTQQITIHANNVELAGQTLVNGGGQFTLDNQCNATVPIEIASECYSHPAYTIPDLAEIKIVQQFLKSSIVVETGNYDAGEIVDVECPEYCSVKTAAPDGTIVEFNKEGFAKCGIKTAKALQGVVPALKILTPDSKDELKSTAAAASGEQTTDDDDAAAKAEAEAEAKAKVEAAKAKRAATIAANKSKSAK